MGITDVKGNRTTYLYSLGGLLTEVREPGQSISMTLWEI